MNSLEEVTSYLDFFFNYQYYPDSIVDTLMKIDFNASSRFGIEYLYKKTGFMIKNCSQINSIYCAVFPSDDLIKHIKNISIYNSLIIVKHPMDWDEFSKGFIPISNDLVNTLRRHKISLYCAHAAHDNNLICSPSVGFAQALSTNIREILRDDLNRVFGCIVEMKDPISFNALKGLLTQAFDINSFQEYFSHNNIFQIAVVAGGGDNPQWLDLAIMKNCDTYLTGILYFRGSQYSQENNPIFIKNLKASGLNALGISHYFSEYRGSLLLVNLLARTVKLPTKFLPETDKARFIQRNWQLQI